MIVFICKDDFFIGKYLLSIFEDQIVIRDVLI